MLNSPAWLLLAVDSRPEYIRYPIKRGLAEPMAKLKGSYRLDQSRWCWISGLQCAPPKERKAELITIERNAEMMRAICNGASLPESSKNDILGMLPVYN
jgi:hypothetical protein